MGLGTLGRGLIVFAVALVPLVPLVPSQVAAAPQPSSGGQGSHGWPSSQGWTSSQAAPSDVVVSRLPAATPAEIKASKPLGPRPLLVKDPAAYAAAKRSPKGPRGTAIAQAPAMAAAIKAPGFASSGFSGISLNQEVSNYGTAASVEPPDTQLAAGPAHLMELVNVTGQVYYKSGGRVGSLFLLRSFFGMPTTYFAGDPRILFDPGTQRWYATVMGFNSAGGSEVILAVSTSSNPTGTWRRYVVYRNASLLCDQPKLGYSDDKLVIGCTDFNGNTFVGGVIIVVSKTQALAGGTVTIGSTGPFSSLYGMVPVQNTTPGKPAYIVQNEFPVLGQSHVGLITLTGDPATGLSHVFLSLDHIPLMITTTPPPHAVQQGSGALIDTGDDRLVSAVLRGPKLWTSASLPCTPQGDTTVRACFTMIEIDVPTLNQDNETINSIVGKYLYYPTLAIDANGDLAVDYTLSSATDYPSHGAMAQPVGQFVPADVGLLQAGTGPYAGSRWGDYGAASVDPTEPTRIWLAGEYSDGTLNSQNWNTGVGAIDFTALQLSPTGIGFGSQALSSTSGSQPLTVTNSGNFPVQVSAALVAGGDSSQFNVVDNACSSVLLAPAATCIADFTFSPTSAGLKQARFNVSAPNFGPLAMVLSGTGGAASACTSTAITTDVPSPQNVGTTVTLNATSAGCPDAGPLYRFYLRSPAGVWSVVQDFSPSASFAWDTSSYPAGTYLTGVWVRDAGSITTTYDAYAFGTFTLQFPACTSTNLSSDLPSPQTPTTTVNFTATVVGCPNPVYQWWVRNAAGVWSIASAFPSGNTFAWDTTGLSPGTYQVGVWAKQTGSSKSYEAFAFVTYTLTASIPVTGTTQCKVVNVGAAPPSPSNRGTAVTLTATPQGCSAPQFRWWIRDTAGHWAIVKDYPGASTYAWSTTSRPAGTYLVGVWVRQSGSASSYQAYSFITYTLNVAPADRPCTSVGITPSASSPQMPGITVLFTATALGCTTPNYRFFVAPPGGAFAQVQPYGSSPSFSWNTADLVTGPYQVGVWARRAGSTSSYQAFAFITFLIQASSTPCTTLTVDTSPSQIETRGSNTLQLTATAGGCSTHAFRLFLRHGAGAYVFWGTTAGPGFTVPLNAMQGPWTAEILADGSSPADSTAFTDFRVN